MREDPGSCCRATGSSGSSFPGADRKRGLPDTARAHGAAIAIRREAHLRDRRAYGARRRDRPKPPQGRLKPSLESTTAPTPSHKPSDGVSSPNLPPERGWSSGATSFTLLGSDVMAALTGWNVPGPVKISAATGRVRPGTLLLSQLELSQTIISKA
jgi:hypothetical protein